MQKSKIPIQPDNDYETDGDLMIEVAPSRYVNWLSALQNGLVGQKLPSTVRRYQRNGTGIVGILQHHEQKSNADNDNKKKMLIDRADDVINLFTPTVGPVRNPYRTSTRWLRDQSGALMRDERGLPVPEPRQTTRRENTSDARAIEWKKLSGSKPRIAKTWLEGRMKEEHSFEERELARELANYRRLAAEQKIIEAVATVNARHKELEASAANDNLQGWELLRQLRRDKRHDDVEVVEFYRGLCGLIASQPLRGIDYGYDSSAEKEFTSDKLTTDEVDVAAAKNWEGGIVPGGEIKYGRVRKRSKSDLEWSIPPKRKVSAKDDTNNLSRPLAVRFNQNTLLAKIDMRPVLEELRAALGIGLDAFEDAVLGGKSLTEIGEDRGFKGAQAPAAGKALVYASIDALRDAWNKIKRRQRAEAKQAIRNVSRARERLEAKSLKRAA